MKIVYEFDSEDEVDKWIDRRANVSGLKELIEKQRRRIEEIDEDRRKAIISTSNISDVYSVDNVDRVKEMTIDKILKCYEENDQFPFYNNLYAFVIKRVEKDYPTINHNVAVALWKEVWEKLKLSGEVEINKEKRVVYKRRVVATADK